MREEHPELILRLEESLFHPTDVTLNNLRLRGLFAKKELFAIRQELIDLTSLNGASEKKQIQLLKKKVSQKHDELMEILKIEEKIYQATQDNNS